MGHTRLGNIPKSKSWNRVVDIVLSGQSSIKSTQLHADTEIIASLALQAADTGLTKAVADAGLQYAFYLLTKIILASKNLNWDMELKEFGITIEKESGIYDLTSEFQAAIDNYLRQNSFSTDISELAQRSAGETLTALLSADSTSLFENDAEHIRSQIAKYATRDGFAKVGQKFFGTFLGRFLNFYLSRITATHTNNSKVSKISDISSFNSDLRKHCEESALIVKDFSGEWFSKTNFKPGINLRTSNSFLAVAIKKLKAELQQQDKSDAQVEALHMRRSLTPQKAKQERYRPA